MPYDLLNFYNLGPNEDMEENLRLALMFKQEVDEATSAYMQILQIVIDGGANTAEEMTQAVREAINASLLTGIRAYRSWIESEGVNVQAVEENSGKDIPSDFFHEKAKWPL